MSNKRIMGYIMTLIGFTLLLFNAIGYLLNGYTSKAAFTIFGLFFVISGLKLVRKI